MVKYLSVCEESILESLAWSSKSSLWTHLRQLKLASSTGSSSFLSQLEVAFPLCDDVFMSSHLNTGHYHTQAQKITTIQQGQGTEAKMSGLLNAAVSSSSDLLVSSPVKQAPTITRVVCSTVDSNSASNTAASNSAGGKTLLQTTSSTAKEAPRLKDMSNFVAYFFRKFYTLANVRMRALIDRLDLAQMSVELYNQNKNVIRFTSFVLNYIRSHCR